MQTTIHWPSASHRATLLPRWHYRGPCPPPGSVLEPRLLPRLSCFWLRASDGRGPLRCHSLTSVRSGRTCVTVLTVHLRPETGSPCALRWPWTCPGRVSPGGATGEPSRPARRFCEADDLPPLGPSQAACVFSAPVHGEPSEVELHGSWDIGGHQPRQCSRPAGPERRSLPRGAGLSPRTAGGLRGSTFWWLIHNSTAYLSFI